MKKVTKSGASRLATAAIFLTIVAPPPKKITKSGVTRTATGNLVPIGVVSRGLPAGGEGEGRGRKDPCYHYSGLPHSAPSLNLILSSWDYNSHHPIAGWGDDGNRTLGGGGLPRITSSPLPPSLLPSLENRRGGFERCPILQAELNSQIYMVYKQFFMGSVSGICAMCVCLFAARFAC